ncbi:MAG: reverse transcriptase family protein, partial [Sedimenticola sp.]
LCVDYRRLNDKTVKDAYPLPRIDEALEALHDSQYFSSIDLAQGFYQVPIDQQDRHKTAFRVGSGGLYEYLRMPMGLCNSPGTFQRLKEVCLAQANIDNLLIYLDDILVYSRSIDDHIARLQYVFSRLQAHGLKMKLRKCHFFQRKVTFLGHQVSGEGVATYSEKTAAIRGWKQPTTEKQLRIFLGLAGYYRRFVRGFSQIAAPLHALLTKQAHRKSTRKRSNLPASEQFDTPFVSRWNSSCTEAFETLKTRLVNSPILGYPDFSKPFILETDASFQGLGAVLSQDQSNGRVVIAYASRSLRPSEKNMDRYSSMKLEMLALKWAVSDKLRDYLLGSKFMVYTDNNPLRYFKTAKLDATKMRWAAQLAQFDFTVKYRSGRSNYNTDALSRQVSSVVQSEESQVQEVSTDLDDGQLLQGVTASTAVGSQLRRDILTHALDDTATILVGTAELSATSTFPAVPFSDLQRQQMSDFNVAQAKKWVEGGHKPTDRQLGTEPSITKKLLRRWDKLEVQDGILWYTGGDPVPSDGGNRKFVTPECMKQQILESLHNCSGHQGVERTMSLVKKDVSG